MAIIPTYTFYYITLYYTTDGKYLSSSMPNNVILYIFTSCETSKVVFVVLTVSCVTSTLRPRWNLNRRIYAPSPKITLLSSLLMPLKTLAHTHTHTLAHTTCRQQLIIFILYTQAVPRNGPRVCVYLYFNEPISNVTSWY